MEIFFRIRPENHGDDLAFACIDGQLVPLTRAAVERLAKQRRLESDRDETLPRP